MVNLILNNGEPGSNTLKLMPKNVLPYKFSCQMGQNSLWVYKMLLCI
ncbi:hypothetical protein Hanom_Chr00s000805g01663581 [Helianthus anomalus]